MDCTVHVNVLRNAEISYRYWGDLLFPFANSQNTKKVILNDQIINEYSVLQSEMFRVWINLITNTLSFSKVDCSDSGDIFIEACRRSHDRTLIVACKNDFTHEQISEISLFFDCDEAVAELFSLAPQIIQIGNNNQATTGNNSPNTMA